MLMRSGALLLVVAATMASGAAIDNTPIMPLPMQTAAGAVGGIGGAQPAQPLIAAKTAIPAQAQAAAMPFDEQLAIKLAHLVAGAYAADKPDACMLRSVRFVGWVLCVCMCIYLDLDGFGRIPHI